MPQVSDIVEVVIVLQASAVARATFAIPLILGDSTILSGRTAKYSSLSAMTSDGWTGAEPEYKIAAKVFGQNPHPSYVIVGKKVAPDTGYDDTLDVVLNERSDWYAVLCESHVEADVLDIAAWVSANARIFITSSSDTEIKDTTLSADTGSIAKQLKTAGYDRVCLFYSATADTEFIEGAFAGVVLPKTPGSYTGKFKSLTGITADTLTDTEFANILEKCSNSYCEIGGVNMVANGTMSKNAGTFFDLIVFVDWMQARISERVFSVFVNADKIPYTDAGAATVEAEVKAVLKEGVANGGLADDPAPTTSVPKVADISSVDKANRHLPDVKFEGTLAGAIHSTKISGVVVV